MMTLNASSENFLTHNFGNQIFDFIIFNPPFKKYGIQFIEKGRQLLAPNGKLVVIMGTDMFNPMSVKANNEPGTFSWMNQRGHFERIELFDGSNKKNYFGGFTNTCWFIWTKEANTKPTIITNALGECFDYDLTGKETFIPMEPYHVIKDYVEWDLSKALNFAQNNGGKKANDQIVIHQFKLFVDRYEDYDNKPHETGLRTVIINNDLGYDFDKIKFKNIIAPDAATAKRHKAIYGKKIATAMNFYPLNKDYFRKVNNGSNTRRTSTTK